jgi:peptidyl-tRNA hydrolase
VTTDDDTELRLYCVMRGDLNAPVGKLLAQAGHAFTGVLWNTTTFEWAPKIYEYMNGARAKIVLKVANKDELLRAYHECQEHDISCYLVIDEGRTTFPEPTVTCLGIGIVTRAELPTFVRRLRLFD